MLYKKLATFLVIKIISAYGYIYINDEILFFENLFNKNEIEANFQFLCILCLYTNELKHYTQCSYYRKNQFKSQHFSEHQIIPMISPDIHQSNYAI